MISDELTTVEPDQETKVRNTFDDYWEGISEQRFAGLYQRLAEPPVWYRAPFTCGPSDELEFLRVVLGDLSGKTVLEFGSGIGWTSLALARAGAKVTLADISGAALAMSRKAFDAAGQSARWVECSIFEPPSTLGQHDLVFNSGLIEHFHRPDQVALLRNMRGLAKDNGLVVAVAPYAGARLYRWAKRRMEANGTWRFGDEFPLQSMADLGADAGLELVHEDTAKPGDQANFVYGVSPWLSWTMKLAYLATLADRTSLWQRLIGDSMIASAFRAQ